jgi:CubicO group peptidase (beta-lactamase class C family)
VATAAAIAVSLAFFSLWNGNPAGLPEGLTIALYFLVCVFWIVIRNVLHDEAEYLAFPRRALFDRLGMSSAVLETDASGTFVGSSYMYATARDWARFGSFYLQDGAWKNERVLPEGWVAYTTSPAPADDSKRYGAHFWLQVPDEYGGRDARLPVPAFHAAGHEAQFVTIVPSRDAVIVHLGRTRYPDAWDHPAFVRDVLARLPRPDHSRPGG